VSKLSCHLLPVPCFYLPLLLLSCSVVVFALFGLHCIDVFFFIALCLLDSHICLIFLAARPITVRHKEHIRYIKNCNPISTYAAHILHNRHEFGTVEDTLQLIRSCRKGSRMNQWEKPIYTNLPPTG